MHSHFNCLSPLAALKESFLLLLVHLEQAFTRGMSVNDLPVSLKSSAVMWDNALTCFFTVDNLKQPKNIPFSVFLSLVYGGIPNRTIYNFMI